MRALYLFVASLYFSVKLIHLSNLASYGNPGDTQNEPQKNICPGALRQPQVRQ
jgi:hypothetical protein